MNDEFGGAKHRILGFSYLFEKPFQGLSLPMNSAFAPRRDLQTERAERLESVLVHPPCQAFESSCSKGTSDRKL